MSEDDVVLSGYESGNFLGGRLPGYVYLGHGDGTADCERKEGEVSAFFSGMMGPAGAADFLRRAGVDWVWFGQFEQRDFGAWGEDRMLGGMLEVAPSVRGAVFIFRGRAETSER